MASDALDPNWLKQEVCSESTFPLLNFLLRTEQKQTVERVTELLHAVTASVGKDPPPLPDEGEQSQKELLLLMKDGPGKVSGNPTVSSPFSWPFRSKLKLYRLPLSEPGFLACALDTSLRKPGSKSQSWKHRQGLAAESKLFMSQISRPVFMERPAPCVSQKITSCFTNISRILV